VIVESSFLLSVHNVDDLQNHLHREGYGHVFKLGLVILNPCHQKHDSTNIIQALGLTVTKGRQLDVTVMGLQYNILWQRDQSGVNLCHFSFLGVTIVESINNKKLSVFDMYSL
jgi:hypothetical protein